MEKCCVERLTRCSRRTCSKTINALKAQHEREKEKLYAQIGRLTTQLNWLEKKLEASVSRPERIKWINWHDDQLSIKDQAALLSLNRTGLYYKPKEPSDRELAIKYRIDEIFTASPF